MHLRLRHGVILALALFAGERLAFSAEKPVQFNRDIRPIFAESCLSCHGPDKNKRKAKLRLDTKEGLFSALDDRYPVVPGKPEQSEIYKRVITHDPDDLMPKSKTGERLGDQKIALIKKWIEQGAKWEGHWAYTVPAKPAVPHVKHKSWVINPVDNFVLARLDTEKLKPSVDADKRTLLRRLSFDLIGLPPTPEEVAAFEADKSSHAYEAAVDRLLASPHYGERMAQYWLDEVRYADTDGFHADNYRSVYPYRDYVIDSFNNNERFDQFTREQLAGDLLPHPNRADLAASTFNRLSRSTEEGGAQPKEYMAKYAADRVRTVSEVWLGSTMACCECHDHKFDPFATKDFYCLEAFFADIKEQGVGARETTMVPDDAQSAKIKEFERNVAQLEKTLGESTPELEAAQTSWEKSLQSPELNLSVWKTAGPFVAKSFDEGYDTAYEPETNNLASLNWTEQPSFTDGEVHRKLQGTNSTTYLYRTINVSSARKLKLYLGSDDAIKVWLNGKLVLTNKIERGPTPDEEQIEVQLQAGENRFLMKIVNGKADSGFYFQAGAPSKMVASLEIPTDNRTPKQKDELAKAYREIAPALESTRVELASVKKQQVAYLGTIPTTLATVSVEPRVMRVLPRGNWMSDAGEVVTPQAPHFLSPAPISEKRATRLDLANWLMSRNNPLPARVFVNRLWKMYFGVGLSKTLDDFGTRGEWPVHQELLDWLATEFEDNGWDVKHMIKVMVMSHTYRQSAVVSKELQERDPDNRLLARQSAIRLDAETVRDNALAVSGLLVKKVGGPSVKPYQPEGYWDQLNFPKRTYQSDHGEALYRRGLYTFWCRTFLQPSMLAFDASSREECTIERVHSNTPLQALALLNDPTYVEAARSLAEETLTHAGPKVDDRITWTFRQTLEREPCKSERDLMRKLYAEEEAHYANDEKDAKELLSVGEHKSSKDLNARELAAWTSIARVVLNLHETITRY